MDNSPKIHNERCVGIDFGTTNSVMASVNVQNSVINTPVRPISRKVSNIMNESRELLPSCVYYPRGRNGAYSQITVGDFAKNESIPFPGQVVKSVKMHLTEEKLPGLSEGVPDEYRKPVNVVSYILRHMLQNAGEQWHENIEDAVITVPANFGPLQSQIILEAAEKAGLKVRDEKGNFDDSILLSEPEAVMYYVLNDIDAGRSDIQLDLDTEKHVLIYDIGGGTTDITIHRIKRNAENPRLIDMDDIATNRFSGVAGDAFDELVAREMYARCLENYREADAVRKQIKARKTEIIQSMKNFAEQLKLAISMAIDEKNTFDLEDGIQCGGNLPINYPYSDYFTLDEYKAITESLLAPGLTLADYTLASKSAERNNIIMPVLDVIEKATILSGKNEMFRPDVVILSGGMSAFGVVRDRIRKLFGDIPVYSCNNPNTAVAQGASVYHYYQHKESELLKKIHSRAAARENEENGEEAEEISGIRTNSVALNESIYLGLDAGSVIQLAKAGDNLPFTGTLKGLHFAGDGKRALIPIKQEFFEQDGRITYRTTALGVFGFSGKTDSDTLEIDYEIKRSKIIVLSVRCGGMRTCITIMPDQKTDYKPLRLTADNVAVNVSDQIHSLKNVLAAFSGTKNNWPERANVIIQTAARAANKKDYGPKVVEWLENAQKATETYACHKLAECTIRSWDEDVRRRYLRIIVSRLRSYKSSSEIFAGAGKMDPYPWVIALSKYGDPEQLKILDNDLFRNDGRLYGPLSRAYAKLGINADWICGGFGGKPEETCYACISIGKIFNDAGDGRPSCKMKDSELVDAILAVAAKQDEKTFRSAIKGIALLCDQRGTGYALSYKDIRKAAEFLENALNNKAKHSPVEIKLLESANSVVSGYDIPEEDLEYLFAI